MIRREGKPFRVEVIDRQVTVRMNDYRPRSFFHCGGVDAVAESFLDDDCVGEVSFGLRQKVAHRHGFSRAAHAEQHRVLRRG
jgi:hypothetical protein